MSSNVTEPSLECARRQIEESYLARTARSRALHKRAAECFPGGVTRSIAHFAPYPTSMVSGSGCRVTDEDGNVYLDLVNNYGSLIHGHGHPRIVEAIRDQVTRGIDYGAPSAIQISLADVLRERVPSLERLRFTASGTEAIMYAIRAARAYTGRSKIVKIEGGYDGGYDAALVSVDPGLDAPHPPRGRSAGPGLIRGLLDETIVAPFNDSEYMARLIHRERDDLAAVLVEPMLVRGTIPAEGEFLSNLRELTQDHGVLLIFDEVVTFRLAWGGAQALYGVRPDLTALGKLIGGGLPVGVFGGRQDIMAVFDPTRPGPAHHSGTYSGNPLTAAAGLAALELLTPAKIARLNQLGDRLRSQLQELLDGSDVAAQVTGRGSLVGLHLTADPVRDYRTARRASREAMRWLHLALLNRGLHIRASGNVFLSTAMGGKEIDELVTGFHGAIQDAHPVLVRPDEIGAAIR